jgi:hypothetical protein
MELLANQLLLFADELALLPAPGRQARRQADLFDRAAPPRQADVLGEVYRAHPALPDQGDHPISIAQ